MRPKMGKKSNKNLYLPDWIIEWLDNNGAKFGGPGDTASTAIMAFMGMDDQTQVACFSKFKSKQAMSQIALQDDEDSKGSVEEKKRSPHRKKPKTAG